MFITFTNCGPTTIIIDSKDLVWGVLWTYIW
jgi:hypothetical protein